MVALIKFETARRALAEAHRVDEVKAIRDKAEALRLYFKQQGESLVMQNQAAEIKLRAERKAGTLLAEMEKSKGMQLDGRNKDGSVRRLRDETADVPTLVDMGITKIQSHRFQQVARIPEQHFEQFIQETVDAGEELTTRGLLEYHPVAHRPSPSPTPPSVIENLPQYLELKHGDALTVLKTFPDESTDMVITSPPYYGLRDYGIQGQIGLEPTLEEYLEKMLAITAELKRVLKKTGTMWWNHGDSYGTSSGSGVRNGKQATNRGTQTNENWQRSGKAALPGYEKSLLLQAHRLAIRMIDEQAWILRNILIWHKPNVMPSSADDRFTVDYEPIFFFTKSQKYYFEPQYEPYAPSSDVRYRQALRAGRSYNTKQPYTNNTPYAGKYKRGQGSVASRGDDPDGLVVGGHNPCGRHKRCVWTIPTQLFPDAHFAVYPTEVCKIPIQAGCPEYVCTQCGKPREKIIQDVGKRTWKDTREDDCLAQGTRGLSFGRLPQVEIAGYTDCGCNAEWRPGVVMDPFFGAGTTAIAASELGRSWIGIELSEEYIQIAKRRLVEHGIYPSPVERIL